MNFFLGDLGAQGSLGSLGFSNNLTYLSDQEYSPAETNLKLVPKVYHRVCSMSNLQKTKHRLSKRLENEIVDFAVQKLQMFKNCTDNKGSRQKV